jgi:UDP-N-acetylmuramate dehydrogenase
LIISDNGFDGLVIINNTSHWEIISESDTMDSFNPGRSRYKKTEGTIQSIENYLHQVQASRSVVVRVDSGSRIAALSKALYKDGIVGLEWFAGIPATVGGGLYMNMHGGPLFFGDLVEGAVLFDGQNEKSVVRSDFCFDYDYSILHETKETVLTVDLCLWKGNPDLAADFAKEWAKEKAFQPRRSAGCIFHNLDSTEQERLNSPTSSMGFVIDQLLGLKGKRHGGAMISENHAAFIENTGNATAQDIYNLVKLTREEARKKLGLELKLEVQFIGKFN